MFNNRKVVIVYCMRIISIAENLGSGTKRSEDF